MKSKEYFKKEYGVDHILTVVELKDLTSLYGLIDEYAKQESVELLRVLKLAKIYVDNSPVAIKEVQDRINKAIKESTKSIYDENEQNQKSENI